MCILKTNKANYSQCRYYFCVPVQNRHLLFSHGQNQRVFLFHVYSVCCIGENENYVATCSCIGLKYFICGVTQNPNKRVKCGPVLSVQGFSFYIMGQEHQKHQKHLPGPVSSKVMRTRVYHCSCRLVVAASAASLLRHLLRNVISTKIMAFCVLSSVPEMFLSRQKWFSFFRYLII